MIRAIPCDGVVGFNLLSTDEKPTQYIKTGSMVFETDTQDKYYFDEVSKTWYKYTGPNLDFYCKLGENVYGFFGLSTDEKPEGFGLGSRFVEVDTSKAYILSDDGWKVAEEPGPTPPGPTPQPTLQDKTVDPTINAQQVTYDSGYDGLGTVSITAVTNNIDANIKAENIKKDITILGVMGTYEGEEPQPVPTTTVDAIILLIDNLPAPIYIAENDRARIHSIREAYETLASTDKALVTNYSELEACEAALPNEIIDLDFTKDKTISDLEITTDTHIIFHDPYYDILVHCDALAGIDTRGLKYNTNHYFEVFNNSKKTFNLTFTFVSNNNTSEHYFSYGDSDTEKITFGTTPVTLDIVLEPGKHIQFTAHNASSGGAYLSKLYCII